MLFRSEWHEAVDRYMKLHQAASPIDHEAETRKLQNVLITVTLKMAADDTEYAASLAARLMAHGAGADSESALLRQYLHGWADELTGKLRGDPAIQVAACEYARAWAGADLADRVRNAADGSDEGGEDAVLLAVAVADVRSPSA